VPEEKQTSILHLIEKRTEKRVQTNVPVEITALDADGKPLTERSFLEDVSDLGCRLTTHGPMKQGDTIALKILNRDGNELPGCDQLLYEIMWVAPKTRGQAVGARLLQGERLANSTFPLEKGKAKRYGK
jgi:hypothetical protein